jgi:hypothetical protein
MFGSMGFNKSRKKSMDFNKSRKKSMISSDILSDYVHASAAPVVFGAPIVYKCVPAVSCDYMGRQKQMILSDYVSAESVASTGSVAPVTSMTYIHSNVGKSKVAGVAHSDVVIRQTGGTSYVTYDYSLQSKACKLGMSILENVSFPLTEVITRIEALELIDEYIDFTHEKMIESIKLIRKYKTDECVICLSQRPDILFLNCGHVCSCTSCIKIKPTDDALGNIVKCPLCKAKIICKIPESTIGTF